MPQCQGVTHRPRMTTELTDFAGTSRMRWAPVIGQRLAHTVATSLISPTDAAITSRAMAVSGSVIVCATRTT